MAQVKVEETIKSLMVKVHCHWRENVAKAVGSTSSAVFSVDVSAMHENNHGHDKFVLEWKRTDRRMEGGDCISFRANVVCNQWRFRQHLHPGS